MPDLRISLMPGLFRIAFRLEPDKPTATWTGIAATSSTHLVTSDCLAFELGKAKSRLLSDG